MTTAISLFIGFIGIGIMVSIHELGHFLAARASSITVEVFAFGWGKPLRSWRKGETEFRINVFPVGGYCRLKGADDLGRALANGQNEFAHIEQGSLFAASPLQRIFTYAAGPLANLIFALIIFIPFFLIGYDTFVDPSKIIVTSDYPALFGANDSETVPASKAGILTGDVILSVDGIDTPDFQTLQSVLASREKEVKAHFIVLREHQRLEFFIEPRYEATSKRVLFGLTSYIEPIVASIEALSPESMAGLEIGDRIIGLQQKPVGNALDIANILLDEPSVISMEVKKKNGTIARFDFIPYKNSEGTLKLQFTLQKTPTRIEGFSFGSALIKSISQTISLVGSTFALIPSLFSGKFKMDEVLSGPIRLSYVIGDMTGSSMRSGFSSGLRMICYILGMVSVSLAVANLLPIPALDGGLILLSAVELIRGKPLSPKAFVRFQTFGVAFILLLMVFALIGDFKFFINQ
jgi:regulator of sigma E protease